MNINLTAEQVERLHDGKKVKGYEGYSIDYDHTTGEFDSEKGSMEDFEIYLYDADEELVGIAYGGYYTGISGVMFNYDLEFEAPAAITDVTKFNDYLRAVALSATEASDELGIIQSKLKDITEYVNKLVASK